MARDGGRFGEVADELYGLPMSEFTAARDRDATAARQAGDRELASELKKLRRPSVAAWLINQLVRQRRAEVEALVRLGSALRDAQAELASADLRRLSQQAQQMVTALGREARGVGAAAGQRVGDGVVREVEETLHAALADPAAGDTVQSGRLISPLSYAGFGSVDVAGAASAVPASRAPRADRAASAAPATRADRAASAAPAAGAARAEAARSAQAQAQAELKDAHRGADERQRQLEAALGDRDRADQRVEELSEELERARGQARNAAIAVRQAERGSRDAERRLARAQAAADEHPGD